MSAASDYYLEVLKLGHSPENALIFTRQHFPDFTPEDTNSSPHPTRVSTRPRIWAAVGCIFVAFLLSLAGQFSHSWVVSSEGGESTGLTTKRVDCELAGVTQIDECKVKTYLLLAEDFDKANAENKTAEDLGNVFVGAQKDYCINNRLYLKSMGLEETLSESGEGGEEVTLSMMRDQCLTSSNLGVSASIVLWFGSIGALLGAVMMSAQGLGRTFPKNLHRHGKWISLVSGLVMFPVVIIAIYVGLRGTLLSSTFTSSSSYGQGLWLTIVAGLLAIAAAFLAHLNQKRPGAEQ